MAEAIVTASALNFLGLGVQPPIPYWGAMVSEGRRFIFDSAYIPLFPGLAITAWFSLKRMQRRTRRRS